MKCIRCKNEADYIYMVLGIGGSYCEKCLKKLQRETRELRKALEELKEELKEALK